MTARPHRVHAILGMHRSGTSWLAGSLEQKGLALGDVNESAPYNRRGTRESERLQSLHDGVLRDSRGSWRDPPRRVVWSESRRRALAAYIEDMDARFGTWGFKDPRSLLLLDEWKRQVGDGIAFVGVFRHPLAVARSLAERDFSPVALRHGLRLWRVYNGRLVAEHRRDPFPLLRFDVSREHLLAAVDDVARRWALPGADAPSTFFDEELVHARGTADRVPLPCRRVWRYLVRHAVEPERRRPRPVGPGG